MLDYTGQPLEPELIARIRLEHLQRYAMCREAVRGKRVLALGAGEGHGGAMLSDTAAQVIGVERNPTLASAAQQIHGRLPHLAYTLASYDRIPLAERSVDVVISYGSFHARDLHSGIIREIRRVLKPEGLFLFGWLNASTPPELTSKLTASTGRLVTLADVSGQLRSFFEQVEFWGQRLAVGSFTFPIDRLAPRTKLRPLTVEEDVITESVAPLQHPFCYIAVCSDVPFEPHTLQFESVAVEPAEDIYAEFTRLRLQHDERHQQDDAMITQLMDRLEAARSAQKTTTRLHSVAVAELQDERLEQRESERLLTGIRQELEATQRALQQAELSVQSTRAEADTRQHLLDELRREHAGTLASLQAMQTERDHAIGHIQERNARLAVAEAQAEGHAAHAAALQQQLTDLLGSTSWRLSAPIRGVRRTIDAILGRRPRP